MRAEVIRDSSTPSVGSGVLAGDRLLLGFALLKLVIHAVAGKGYGYFRDEFYYLACSEHLAWGYVDHPPLSVAVLRVWRTLAGDSVVAIRLLPALAGAATVYIVGKITRQLGGGIFAQLLAMSAALAAPAYLSSSGYYSMNAFGLLIWAVAAWLLVRLLDDGPQTLWPVLGLVLGLGLLNKISVLWLGFGILVGLLLTPQRRWLATRGPWIAGISAGLLFLPHLIWQQQHDWPTLEFMRNASANKMRSIAPLDFLGAQIFILGPFTLLIWGSGLVGLFWLARLRSWRLLGWIWIAVAALLMLNGTSRAGYLVPAYAGLLAAGGVTVEHILRRVTWGWLRPLLVASLLLPAFAFAPFAIPLLPVNSYIAYAKRMGIGPSTAERKALAELPQHYADMFGWNELVNELARIHQALPEEDRREAAIFVYNYGEAGAIDLLGRDLGLPRALSGHNNYWFWGPRGYSGDVLIVVGGSERGHHRLFDSVEAVGRTDCTYCMPYENDQTIWLLRNPKGSFAEAWPSLKHYD